LLAYVGLNLAGFGNPPALLGTAELTSSVATDNANQLAFVWLENVDKVMGLKVDCSSPLAHSNVWQCLDLLSRATVNKKKNVFPVAFKIDREYDPDMATSSGSLVLVLEHVPECVRLGQVLGPVLTSFLFHNPILLRTCKQSISCCHMYRM
jgi:hypothetical protein